MVVYSFRGLYKPHSSSESGFNGVGEKMQEAVEKSYEISKETVEGSAKSAAQVIEQTVSSTTEKVKRSNIPEKEYKEDL